MRIEERLVMAWAMQIAERVTDAVISRLEQLKDMLAGDDSGLENVWEEVCVQVQGEESMYWHAYEDVIDQCVHAILEASSSEEIVALWLSDEPAWEWLEEHKNDDMHVGDVPASREAIVEAIRGKVLAAASDFESDRIDRYLRGAVEDEEPPEEEWEPTAYPR